MDLPQEYIIAKFNEYCGGVKHNRSSGTYYGSCYICREGDSWLKKRRCYLILKRQQVYCHNCGWSSTAYKWIKHVTGLSYREILAESDGYIADFNLTQEVDLPKVVPATLPQDCINLFDPLQVAFHRTSSVVYDVLDFVKKRRLNTAVNKPKALWLSLIDPIHRNRLVIPFYGLDNSILYYQSRGIFKQDLENLPKYLGKSGGNKTLFGVNAVSDNLADIYIFEGPINAFFCQNGIAVAGIQDNSETSLTFIQEKQLSNFPLHKKIWVLDSQWIDTASLKKTEILIRQGCNVFIWPKELGLKHKDFNDIAIAQGVDEIDLKFVNQHVMSGLLAELQLANIKRELRLGTP